MLWFGCSSWIPCLKSHFLGTCLYLVTAARGRIVSPPASNAPLKVQHLVASQNLSQRFLLISDFYPKAIGAIINDRVVAESENSQVQHRGGASKGKFFSICWLVKLYGGCAKFGSRNDWSRIVQLSARKEERRTCQQNAHWGGWDVLDTTPCRRSPRFKNNINIQFPCQSCPSLWFKPWPLIFAAVFVIGKPPLFMRTGPGLFLSNLNI